MTDHLTPEKRSWNMARIKSADTKPEKAVRSILHRMGYRFRLHGKDLPGRPDIVLPKHRTVIFVHGCYWHRHEGCRYSFMPKSRVDFWAKKFKNNVKRDKRNQDELKMLGWKVMVIWECELKDPDGLQTKLSKIGEC
jgi:DNA mismatch endonuclease, patch repair protein